MICSLIRTLRSFVLKSYLRVISAKELMIYDNIMIIAPHPDDEALACGGLISLARSNNKQVSVVFMTDGGASHQGCCCNIPPESLGNIRRQLAIRANATLGVKESNITWLNLYDGRVPDINNLNFHKACDLMSQTLGRINPQVVLTPHLMDVWPDHVATNQITRAALMAYKNPVILYYYPVWFFLKTRLHDCFKLNRLKVISLNIHSVMDKKEDAIKCYMRDINPICGIPYSGQLPPCFVELFQDPYELYFTDDTNDYLMRQQPW